MNNEPIIPLACFLPRLLRSIPLERFDLGRLVEAQAALDKALRAEDHRAIAQHDLDLEFACRGAAIPLCVAALGHGAIHVALILGSWVGSGIPKIERREFIELLLARHANTATETTK